ncbi:uncharacterized protein BT62DRAFT_1072121 [Guyanagaster necrorhizus]|uniref:Uncharacterized protein n=1 Tax=Guyanagaster necrorhizus TaxID=856835 RepID=A0A9P7W2V5_9AGAR|nr:uncharacterized protein BT62DRAFT_1072121 [Guyanagaster necrorhizus MCA 3950]KAG7451569.1 hypothetical protein BT62DRAFT_1072121 [Guyanagaster necrorhizus MCA 3950]
MQCSGACLPCPSFFFPSRSVSKSANTIHGEFWRQVKLLDPDALRKKRSGLPKVGGMIGRSIPLIPITHWNDEIDLRRARHTYNLRHDSFAPKYPLRVVPEDHERLDDTPDIAPLFPALTWMMSLAYGGEDGSVAWINYPSVPSHRLLSTSQSPELHPIIVNERKNIIP